MRFILFHAIALVALVFCGKAGFADDWPQWGGDEHRNMVSQEKNLASSFTPGNKKSDGSGVDMRTTKSVKWAAKLGSTTFGNPTVAGGKVFVGTNDFDVNDPRYSQTKGGSIRCFDEATGKLLWQQIIPQYVTSDPNMNFDDGAYGVCSSPTVQGDKLYVVSNRAEVLCMDVNGIANGNDGPFVDEAQYTAGPGKPPIEQGPSDGDILWRFDMFKELNVWPQDAASCSVLIHGDVVYTSTANGVDRSHDRLPNPKCPALIALDKHTGRLVAQEEEGIGSRLFHGQWSSPSAGEVDGKSLIFFGGGDGVCYAFEALSEIPDRVVPLKKVWSFDCNPPEYKCRNGKPIPYRDGDIRCHAEGNKGDGTWIGPSDIIATPVFHKNRIYVATGQDPLHGHARGLLHCIDATKTGDISQSGDVWKYDRLDRSISSVSIADGLLYLVDLAGDLHCLDAETGACYWVHHSKAETWGSTLVADGKVYFGTHRDFWILAAGKELRVLSQTRLGAPCCTTPIAANGVVFIASHRNLWALQSQPVLSLKTGTK